MNRVAAALSPERTRVDVPAVTKQQALWEAACVFASYEGWDTADIAAALRAREAIGSTGLGDGFAIPHARLKCASGAVAAFLRLRSAIPFDAPDAKPVSEMLVMLVPQEAGEEHLQMLAEAAQMFNDRRFRDHLHHQSDPESIYRAFAEWSGGTVQQDP